MRLLQSAGGDQSEASSQQLDEIPPAFDRHIALRIPAKVATQSAAKWPPVPIESGHPVRRKAARNCGAGKGTNLKFDVGDEAFKVLGQGLDGLGEGAVGSQGTAILGREASASRPRSVDLGHSRGQVPVRSRHTAPAV